MFDNICLRLRDLVAAAVKQVYESVDSVPVVEIELPAHKEHGDLACNIALRLSKLLRKNPFEVAATLQSRISENISVSDLRDIVSSVEIFKPGFINFHLTPLAYRLVLTDILSKGPDYGRTAKGQGKRVLVEFVSANPTGPLTVAHARQAAVGDVLVNILNFTGHHAEREFYVNDGGNQIRTLGLSVQLRCKELFGEKKDYPQDCYQGEYIRDMARLFSGQKAMLSLADAEAVAFEDYCRFAKDYLMAVIHEDLRLFRVQFDNWSFEGEVATPDKIAAVLEDLRAKGFIYEKEGALWFASTQFGDDKDRVVRKSDGFYTYLAPDIVYHKNKYDRGFDLLVDILGPDHHGYIPRIKAAAQALGKDATALEGLIIQLATIFRDGKQLRMSTRAGEFITLREVVDEVGTDAGRFFMLMRQVSQQLEFDIDLARKQAPENPVYYIQYAYARISNILRKAKEEAGLVPATVFSMIGHEAEIDLIKSLTEFPEYLNTCASDLDPFSLTRYTQELAAVFHRFYDRCRVIDEDRILSAERLALCEAARLVLSNSLKLLGVTAPERM